MTNEPIMLCYWYDSGGPRTVQAVLRRANIPAEVRVKYIRTTTQFRREIADWYAASTNTQYLIVVAHGIQEEGSSEWIGIGIDGGSNQFITWADLWQLAVRPKKKPPQLTLLGCHSVDAAKQLQQSLTARWNNPVLIGLDAVVNDKTIISVVRLAIQILKNIPKISITLDKELATLRPIFPHVKLYHPVKVDRSPRRYVDSETMQAEIGMSYRKYLDSVNTAMARESARRARPRR